MAANPTIEIEALKDVTPLHSYYYENVFSLEDLYLFRAVFHFYGGNQEQAIADYLRCQEIKYEGTADKNHGKKTDGTGFHTPNAAFNHEHCNESIRAYSQSSTPMLSMNSSRTDLSDVGLCSLNVHETNYNIMLCYLMKKEFAKAVEKINEIVREAPGKY
jgi:tetratricopeptide (TPR) repeat protein